VLQEFALGAAIALMASVIACRAQMASGPVDVPNSGHKSHPAPTPTSGGVGIAIGFAIGLIALCLSSRAWRQSVSADGAMLLSLTCGLACVFMMIGFIDDARPLGPRLKLFLFAMLSLVGAFAVGVVEDLPLGGGAALHLGFALGLVGAALWVFTLVNCVNFMDGANGLAMGSVAVGLIALGVIALLRGSTSGAAIGFCGAGALVGFLVWNFPDGRLFAGDSGALFAGALAALGSLFVIARTGLSPFVPPILFFPLLADVLLTLVWRASRRRRLMEGHCEHLYQVARRSGWRHTHVALTYWAAMALCGTLGLAAAAAQNTIAPWATLAALALCSIIVSYFVRRAS
jgi:UDP-N-acetylmuramyl pentapeptide phosphotransferase/UDP-N-acetylglucosamine-1-phosphate transferase